MSRRLNVRRRWFLPSLAVLALVAAACGGSASAGGSSSGSASGSPSMHIVSPRNGATVSTSFPVKIDASVPLGDPSTGDDHVHLCFDGGSCDTEYKLVYGNTFAVTTLSPGTHTIEASLRNADHSAVGPTDTITVHVGSGTAGSGTTSSTTSTGSSGTGASSSSSTNSSTRSNGGYGTGGGYGGGY